MIENKYGNFFDLIPTIERIAEVYETRKKTANSMDFDDLLLLLSSLLNTNDAVRESLARRFRYVLVDEFQDTNVIQAGIVRDPVPCMEICWSSATTRSIYSFRAAEIKIFSSFLKRIQALKHFACKPIIDQRRRFSVWLTRSLNRTWINFKRVESGAARVRQAVGGADLGRASRSAVHYRADFATA